MRLPWMIGFGCAAIVVLMGADVLSRYQWEPSSFEEACYQFVASEGTPSVPSLPASLKVLAAGQRRAVVEALGVRAKAYYDSEAFKRTWTERHGGRHRDAGQEQREAEASTAQQKAEAQAAKSLEDMEKMIPMMPPEVQAQMRSEMAKAKVKSTQLLARSRAKSARGAATEAATPAVPDPKAALKKALLRFLQVSEGVEFNAPLVHRDRRSYFSNPAYESKPEVWKACFRAGREGTEAARAYAKAWLAELK